MRTILILLTVLATLFVACNGITHKKSELATPPQSSHWIEKARLRDLMDQLGESRANVWPQEIEGARVQEDQEMFAQVRLAAMALSESAQEIPNVADHLKMHEVDRRSFVAQAMTLRDQAGRLEDAAAAQDMTRMKRLLDTIDITCNSCHRRFREFAGPLLM